jgi:hypothetical protein
MSPTRRRLLAGIAGAGTAGLLAGCAGDAGDAGGTPDAPGSGSGSGSGDDPTDTPTGTDGPAATPTRAASALARQGRPPTICEEPVSERSGIYAVIDPAFDDDWSGHEVGREYGDLADEDVVIGLTDGDRARAYPVSVLYHHEIVNDDFGGPVIVTFCPLCNSGMVAARLVGGEPATFTVTGLLWRAPDLQSAVREDRGDVFGLDGSNPDERVRNSGNLVMVDDATGSYWSQILATAICGPESGTDLSIRPSTTATWGEWRREHPGTEVLLPPPHSVDARPG